MLKLSLPEIYKLSPIERKFVDIYNKWQWTTTENPIEVFNKIPNPQGLDLEDELNRVDRYLEKKALDYTWKKDTWISWLAKWLRTSKRSNTSSSSIMAQRVPFFLVMDQHFHNLKPAYRLPHLEAKHERIWAIISKDFDQVKPQVKAMKVKAQPEKMDWLNIFFFARAEKIGEKTVLDLYIERIKDLISKNEFDEEFLSYLAFVNPGLLTDVLDFMFGPEHDNKDLDHCLFVERLNHG